MLIVVKPSMKPFLNVDAESLARSVRSQCLALAKVARAAGVAITHVKPHGALYHAANLASYVIELVFF